MRPRTTLYAILAGSLAIGGTGCQTNEATGLPTLPHCVTDEAVGPDACVYVATDRHNGAGHSFVYVGGNMEGVTLTVPDHVARMLTAGQPVPSDGPPVRPTVPGPDEGIDV